MKKVRPAMDEAIYNIARLGAAICSVTIPEYIAEAIKEKYERDHKKLLSSTSELLVCSGSERQN